MSRNPLAVAPLVKVDDNPSGGECAVVSGTWFDSAFDCAFGQGTADVLDQFHAALSDAIKLYQTRETGIALSEEEFLDRLQRLSGQMSVAAEWARRLEKLAEKSGAP